MPSSLDPTLAPEGCHVLSLFTQYTPYLPASGAWNDESKEKYCEKGVYVCVCMCVCVCVYMYVCVHVYVCMCMCACVCVHVYVCMCVCVYVGIHAHMCIHVHVCIHVCIYPLFPLETLACSFLTVFNCIEEYAPGFKQLVVGKEVLTPPDLERIFGLTGGVSPLPLPLSSLTPPPSPLILLSAPLFGMYISV